MDEVKTCSDGVTVDLTPPTPGHVWIGIDLTEIYQVNIRIVDTSSNVPCIDNSKVF